MTWFGWISLFAGIIDITAVGLQALAGLNNPNYVPETWHITMIMLAMLLIIGLMNMYAFWLIPWIELIAGVLHICLFVVFIVVFVTIGHRNSAHDIFIESEVSSGWTNTFVSWNVGLLSCAWSFTGKTGSLCKSAHYSHL